jgi:hypothetical protein
MPNEEIVAGTSGTEGTPAAGATGTTPDNKGATPPQESQFTYKEDRSKWIPPTRFTEVNTGYQTEKQKREQLERDLEQERRRVQALTGVTPKRPEEMEDEEIRAAFKAKFPHLAELTAEDIAELRNMRQSRERLEETTNNYWRNHGRQMIGKATNIIVDKLNGAELTERQQKRIAREYIQYIEENAEQGALDRHEAGDERLVEEFVKTFLEDWQETIRKSVVTQELGNRRPVPGGGGRRVSTGAAPKPINHSDPNAEAEAAIEVFKNLGGTFGGR